MFEIIEFCGQTYNVEGSITQVQVLYQTKESICMF